MIKLNYLLLLSFVFLFGCNSKGFVKPRSDIISDGQAQGLTMKSLEEEREAFLAYQRESKKRVLQLVEKRLFEEDFDPNYKIGPGDEIEVRVFDVPELNTNVRASHAGYIDLPLVGAVPADGKTQVELESEIKSRLKRFVKDPQVSAYITLFGSQQVAVLGEVAKPGRYPLQKGNNSLLELLSTAGGVTERAGSYINFVPVEFTGLSGANDPAERVRYALKISSDDFDAKPADGDLGKSRSDGIDAGSNKNALEIFLEDIYGTTGSIPLEIPVRAGDMIIVPESGRVLVEGEVQKTGSIDLGKRTTLLGALAAAGGITYSAKHDEVELIRSSSNAGESLRFVVNLEDILNGNQRDVPVRNGDVIRVPSHSGRRMAQSTFDGLSRIINFGVGSTYQVSP
jgi:polysaccharide export outer membrane protein